MKKLFLYILILVTLAGLFGPKVTVQAQTPPATDSNYQLLAPLPCPPGAVGCTGNEFRNFDPTSDASGKNPRLGEYLNLMIKIIIGLSAVLAVVMIVLGGMEYMTSELISSKEAGKERIRGALLGLLIALGAYALLFTINPDLLKSDIKIDQATVEVDLNVDVPQGCVDGRCAGYTERADWATTSNPSVFPTLPGGVTTNHPGRDCAAVGEQNCTSLRGLDPSIINSIRAGCSNCRLEITGGTESWLHGRNSSHRPGSPTVDLSGNTELNGYIMGGPTAPKRGDRYSKNGVSFFFEGDHWHVYR